MIKKKGYALEEAEEEEEGRMFKESNSRRRAKGCLKKWKNGKSKKWKSTKRRLKLTEK